MNKGTYIKNWLEQEGEIFLKKIGIERNNIVLDFGCRDGHYTIPAAKLVGTKGKIYALDREKAHLDKLEKTIMQYNLKNIELIHSNTKTHMEDHSIDVVLCYDVIHFEKNRKMIYNEIRRVLKPTGFFSLYPKHHKDDDPLMELAALSLENIVSEVEISGFILKEKLFESCIHDDYYNKGIIFNFIPIKRV